jgi:hypothetical protein
MFCMILNLVLLWNKFGFSVLCKGLSICKKKNFFIFEYMSFSSWYEKFQPRYVKVFTCSNIVLSITILLLIGSVPLKVMILGFWREISVPNACTVWCKAWSRGFKGLIGRLVQVTNVWSAHIIASRRENGPEESQRNGSGCGVCWDNLTKGMPLCSRSKNPGTHWRVGWASHVRWKIFPYGKFSAIFFHKIFLFKFFREIFIAVILMTQHSCRLQLVRGCYTYWQHTATVR